MVSTVQADRCVVTVSAMYVACIALRPSSGISMRRKNGVSAIFTLRREGRMQKRTYSAACFIPTGLMRTMLVSCCIVGLHDTIYIAEDHAPSMRTVHLR